MVFFDALRVKIRDEATVRIKAVYLALAVLPDGSRDILGIWIEQTEGAKFWMKVFTDLKTRGCQDLLIAVTDGLKGMEEALAAVFPRTTLQTCIVHLLRQSLDFANWKQRKPLAVALRAIYTAPSADLALGALDAFEHGEWGQRFPTIGAAWRRAWPRVIPFFAFPPEIRRVIYTTNALESVHAQLRKIIKTRGHFPNDEAATKLIWLALRNITATWERAATHVAPGHESIRDSLRRIALFRRRRKMHPRMDAAVPVDAQNAPTGTWKTAQNAVSHSAHTHRHLTALHTEILTLPTAARPPSRRAITAHSGVNDRPSVSLPNALGESADAAPLVSPISQ